MSYGCTFLSIIIVKVLNWTILLNSEYNAKSL